MPKKIILLGYGKMGKLVFEDLVNTAEFDELVVADAHPGFFDDIQKLNNPKITPVQIDADNIDAMVQLFKGADIVVELLPIKYTMNVAKAAVEAGVHLISSVFIIDWSIKDPEAVEKQKQELRHIHTAAKEKGLTVLKEFGMDPGLDVVLLGEAIRRVDDVRVIYNYGAGFPEHKLSTANPIGYKFTWSIVDTMCSYNLPGRIKKNGEYLDVPADGMFTPGNYHILNIPELGGPLECFVNGDCDSLFELFPHIKESAETYGRYICRWPRHAAIWETLVKCGFVGTDPIDVKGQSVVPAEFCAALLGGQEQFNYAPDEKDAALIRSDVRGYKDGKPVRAIMQLIDYRDCRSGKTAMQRTVAYPMSIGAQMILNGSIDKRGVVDPCHVPYEPFVQELEKRGLYITEYVCEWDNGHGPE